MPRIAVMLTIGGPFGGFAGWERLHLVAWSNGSFPVEGEWLLLVAAAGAVGWCIRRASARHLGLRQRLEADRARHVQLAGDVRRLGEAAPWIRLFTDCSETHRSLEVRILGAIAQAERIEHRLAKLVGELQRGRTRTVESGLAHVEARSHELSAELDALREALRGLQEADRACAKRHAEITEQLRALRQAAQWPSAGWGADLLETLAVLEQEMASHSARQTSGDPIGALQALEHAARQLAELHAALSGREASLRWLRAVPHEARRLASEAARLQDAGYRELPEVPEAELGVQADAAIALLTSGRLARATLAQQRLQGRLQGLRAEIIGREEARQRNARSLKALRVRLECLREQEAGLPAEACRLRFPAQLWESAESLNQRIKRDLEEAVRLLDQAAEANGLETQRFFEAEATLRLLCSRLDELRQDLGRCETLWHALFEEEAFLQARFMALLGRTAEAQAHARQLGMATDPGLDALLLATRHEFDAGTHALDAIAHALDAAERSLERYVERLQSVHGRLASDPKWRPGPVSFLRTRADRVEIEPHGKRPKR